MTLLSHLKQCCQIFSKAALECVYARINSFVSELIILLSLGQTVYSKSRLEEMANGAATD